MKKSLFFATLTLALGLMVGCGDDKKAAGGGGTGAHNCPANHVWSSSHNACLNQGSCQAGYALDPNTNQCVHIGHNSGANSQWYSSLNVTNSDVFERMLEVYGICTRDWEGTVFGGLPRCSTFDDRTLAISMNGQVIASEGTAMLAKIRTSSYGWNGGGSREIYIPYSATPGVAKRISNDSQFLFQSTVGIYQISIYGEDVDFSSKSAMKVTLYLTHLGKKEKFATATLYRQQ